MTAFLQIQIKNLTETASVFPCPEKNMSAHTQEIAVKISMESTKEDGP